MHGEHTPMSTTPTPSTPIPSTDSGLTPGVAADPQQGKLSELQRITKIFYAPSETFADLRRSSLWIGAFLVFIVGSLAYSGTIGKKIGWTQVAQNQLRMAPESRQQMIENLPPDQKAAAMKQQVKITKAIGYGFPVLNLVWLCIVALVLWGTFNFGCGAELTFNQSLAIVMYASLVGLVKTVIAIVTVFVGVDGDSFMIQNPVGTNPGYYLNFSDTPRFLYSIASSLDAVMLWVLVITGIGFAVVGKMKRGTAIGVVIGWYAVFALITAGMGAAFS